MTTLQTKLGTQGQQDQVSSGIVDAAVHFMAERARTEDAGLGLQEGITRPFLLSGTWAQTVADITSLGGWEEACDRIGARVLAQYFPTVQLSYLWPKRRRFHGGGGRAAGGGKG